MPLPQTVLQDIKVSFEYVHQTLLNSTTLFMLRANAADKIERHLQELFQQMPSRAARSTT